MRGHNNIRKNTMREKAWRLMRSLVSYTLSEIATLAEADVENIRHYHGCLVAAGYARQVGKKTQEGRPGFDKIFRLIKNTGPKPPVQKDLRFIFDPNNGEYWTEDPERVAIVTRDQGLGIDNGSASLVPSSGLTGKIKLGSGVRKLCPRAKAVPHVD